jgi:hypothetical protein
MLASFRKCLCAAALLGAALGIFGVITTRANAHDGSGAIELVQYRYYDSSANSLKDWFVAWYDGAYHNERRASQADALAQYNYEVSLNHTVLYGYRSEFEGRVVLARYQRH